MTQYITKLPAIFQTVTEKKFFDATFDQVFSKKDSNLLAGYIGRRTPGNYNPVTDFYLPEPSKNRTWWQLEATAFARTEDTTKSNIFFYEDLLERLGYYGANTLNQDRLFESEYYSFGPPIDYDMFINYQDYYWVEQGLSVISISGISSTDIIGKSYYTTPPTASPPDFTISTGMTISIIGDPIYSTPHVVENMGGCIGIQLVPQFSDFTLGTIFEYLPWDGFIELSTSRIINNINWDTNTWDTQTQPGQGDYITIERGSADRNAWSRTNKWFHIDTIKATSTITSTAFPINSTRALRPIIQFIADLGLYKSGTQFRSEIKYGFRDNSSGQPLKLADYQDQQQSYIDSTLGINLNDKDLVCFFNDDTIISVDLIPWDLLGLQPWDLLGLQPWDEILDSELNRYILQANLQLDGTINFTPYTDWTTPVLEGDIVFATSNAPYNGALRGSTWYFSSGVWQSVFEDKTSINQAPLFQLYDHNGVELDDPITYPLSTFRGNKIFSYKVNTTPGASVDPVLNFPIVYTALGQASDIVFQNTLTTQRYTYETSLLPIDGYYYYKTTTSPVLFNNWNLYQPCNCNSMLPPTPSSCLQTSKQRVIDRYVVGYGTTYQFKLSVTPYGFDFSTPTHVPAPPPEYEWLDILVYVNGVVVGSDAERTDGYTYEVINGNVYVNLVAYLTALFTSTQSQPPVVEIYTYTQGLLDPLAPGYFEIPQQLDANPNQLEVYEISGSNLSQQFVSIINNQLDEEGSPEIWEEGNPNGTNNYRDTRKNRSVGTFILQNTAPLLKTMLISSSDDLDFIVGERFSQDEYTKFKNKYLRTALQLINQGFNPVQYHNNTIVISAWVEEILKTVNISNEFSNAFAYSYMIANGSPYMDETQVVPISGEISLTNYLDLSDPRNALYIYDTTGQETLSVIGEDYEIVSINLSIDIRFNLDNVPAGSTVFFALYKNPLPAYIPSTPSKIGAYPTYIPKMEWDTSYINPTNVIIGHDGSKTIAYSPSWNPATKYYIGNKISYNGYNYTAIADNGPALTPVFPALDWVIGNLTSVEPIDYRDRLLLELEKRIYNLIQFRFRHQFYLPLRVESVKSGYFRQTRYSRQEYLDVTNSYLNKWCAKNKANYRANDWYSMYDNPAVVPNFTPGVGNIWKLYNYRSAVDSTGQSLNLPGNWKGIFQYYYDTYCPDTRPWEMLGFNEQPGWWQYEYGAPAINFAGQEVWTSTASAAHDMWPDLEAGYIRQGPSAIYDPITLLVQPQEMWARPGLSAIIPVTATGEIIPVPTLFSVAFSGNFYEPFDHFDAEWIYGDGAPVEQAWMSTSAYTFSVQEFLYLMKPAAYGELMWDTIGTEISPGTIVIPGIESPVMSNTNWQFVQNDTFTNSDPFFAWMRPKNADQIVHAESVNNIIQIRYGYQRWISDRILFLGKDVTSTFGQKVRTLDVNLANKLAGFTNKDTTNTYIESVSPAALTNSLIIPSTNFDVILHKSPVVDTYSYSGVIIRALADGTFAVYGYDLLNAEFTTLARSNATLIDITIGGTPAAYQYFATGVTYNPGDIVRYNGVYYTSLVTQITQRFISSNYQKLKSLPIVGGVSVSYKPVSTDTIVKVPYGSILKTTQDVFDLMIGWGAYLESQGWKFDEVNQDTNQLSDWLASAKQFLFWLNTSWAPDASIQLSPLANKATLVVSRGYPNDVESLSNGVYSILDKFGVAIAPNNTSTNRDGMLITVEPVTLASGGIYYLQVSTSETEHILMFDNITSFNDTVYSPLLRARQQRLRFNGFRSNAWYGKMEAPGYLVMDNQLVPNFDTIVESMRYYYDPNTTIDNPSLEDLGRHLIGYESKSYLDNLEVANDVQYLFYQGAIRQKGTAQAFDKLFRSTKVQSDEIIEVYEEWALKLGEFGNTIEQVSTEFILQPEQNTGEVIIARLNFIPSSIGFVKQINILNAQNTYTTVPKIIVSLPNATPDVWTLFNTSTIYNTGDVVRYDDTQGNPVYYSSDVVQGPLPSFASGSWTVVLKTWRAKAYAVLDIAGRISRVDITEPGYGYSSAPIISINSGAELHDLDRLYSIWQGKISKDTTLDNIIDIDIDQTDVWTVRPNDPSYSLEFPTTDKIDYGLPNAGYVNFNDVTWSSFDVTQTAINWGTPGLNPAESDTVWIAKNFTEDWSVYKLVAFNNSWTVTKDADNNILLLTNQSAAATLNISPQGPAAITAKLDNGYISAITVDVGGSDYNASHDAEVGWITITDAVAGAPTEAATAVATISNGAITSITITHGGAGYISPIINIPAPDDTIGVQAVATAQVLYQVAIDTIVNGGGFYSSTPTISFIGEAILPAEATATITDGIITGVTIDNPGAYSVLPTISVSEASIITTATLVPIVDQTIGAITSVIVTNGGSGYTVGATITANRVVDYNSAYIDAVFVITSVGTSGEIIEAGINVTTQGTGYQSTDPGIIIPQLSDSIIGDKTDFGNMVVLQQVINGRVITENNYTVCISPYTTTDYTNPGTYYDASTGITYNAYYLTTLGGIPITTDEIGNYADFTSLLLYKTMRWYDTPVEPLLPVYVKLGDLVWVDNVSNKWVVFKIQAAPGIWDITEWDPSIIDFWSPDYGWDVTGPMYFNTHRIQEALINSSLFESASVFAIASKDELVQLPIYDPFKNILPGPAKQNISYISMQDPASYNVTADASLFSENIRFAERQVGQLWWDISSTRYVYYEQPIALDGSETVLENLVYRRNHWGQIFPGSTVSMYEWVKSSLPPALYTGSGVPKDTTTYVQTRTSNRFTGAIETNFYFWVLNTTDKPNIENRTLAAIDVARLLQAPKTQGFAFFCPIQQTSTDNCYMFYNIQQVLAYRGNNIQIKYRLSERDDQEHVQWAFFREGDTGSIVTDQFWNKMVDSLCGYTKVLPISNEYDGIDVANNPWDMSEWDLISWDSYGEILPVPDPTLSEGEKYGIDYRPRQGMFVSLSAARKVFVQSANALLKYIPIRDNNLSWNNGTDTDAFEGIYWNYTDWYALGYENVTPTIVFQTLTQASDALIAGSLNVGNIVEVSNGTPDGRFILYAVVQLNPNISTLSLDEIGIENSAINLLDTIYTVNNVYSLSQELRNLLNTFRTEVMVDSYLVDQNELFFSMINYVMSEQRNPNWVFKTSYIYIKENNLPLSQSQLYIPDQISNIIQYIIDSKPYHTQIRDYTSTNVTSDIAPGTATDSYNWNIKVQFGPDYAGETYTVPLYTLNAKTFTDNFEQFVSRKDVYTAPVISYPWPIGDHYSSLYRYTLNLSDLTINNPQTFITPYNIVGIQADSNVMIYGQDYYVDDNGDTTYTVYFYNDPTGYTTLVALVWFDGGQLETITSDTYRNETANGIESTDDLVVNVDTKLPVNSEIGPYTVDIIMAGVLYRIVDLGDTDFMSIGATSNTAGITFTATAPGTGTGTINIVYSAINDMWDLNDPVIEQIIKDEGGTVGFGNSFWDQDTTTYIQLLDNTISFKENTNINDGPNFYRNAEIYSGTLVLDLPELTAGTENLDVITVTADNDVFPDPDNTHGTIWINGERIQYRMKTLIGINTWELRLIQRGTMGTSSPLHTALSTVWVERGNIMPIDSNIDVWNVISFNTPYMSGYGIDLWGNLIWAPPITGVNMTTLIIYEDWIVSPVPVDPLIPDYSKVAYQANTRVKYGGINYCANTLIYEFENQLSPPLNPLFWTVISLPEYTSVSGVPLGGLWYAQTPEALFLKQAQGISIP